MLEPSNFCCPPAKPGVYLTEIRNEFAHNIHGCTFDNARVKSRVCELNNSHGIIQRSPHWYTEVQTTRDQFLVAASWMVFHLNRQIENIEAISSCEPEFGYSFIYTNSIMDPDGEVPKNQEQVAIPA